MRYILVFLAIIFVGILSGAGYTYVMSQKSASLPTPSPTPIEVQKTSGFAVENEIEAANPTTFPQSSLSELPTVVITHRSDKKSITLAIQNIKGIASIDYLATYTSNGIEKAVHSLINVGSGEKFITRDILLGTCSGSVCTYDANVSEVTFAITYTFLDGSTSQVNKTHTL